MTVARGEVMALVGRNGAGKSTTLRSLIALGVRCGGVIRFDGKDVSRLATHQIVRRGLGYVPEDRRIFADLTVMENLSVGRRSAPHGATAWTPERLFALFPNLSALRHRRGNEMSGGEQQMLAIARSLMGNPSMMLLDEPSEGLAPKIVQEMGSAILAMKQEGLAILLAEQNLRFAGRVADRATLIEQGCVRFFRHVQRDGSSPERRFC